MQNVRELSTAVGIATLLVTGCAFGLLAVSFKVFPALPDNRQEIIGVAVVLLPMSAAAWGIFRKLERSGFPRREARAVTIAYAASCPCWLVLALFLGEIPGSIAEHFLGRVFILPGVFIGTVLVAAILSFGTCTFILWLTRRGEELSSEKTLDA